MEMTGEQRIPLAQQEVWQALNDPEVLKACIPGCDTLEKVADNEYRVGITAVVGPVKAKFNGNIRMSDLDPPNAYRLSFEGKGGAAGFGKGDADVRLRSDGGVTVMTYTAKAQVGGKLAQVGSRLIDGAAHKVAHDFFSAFNARIAPAGEGAAAAPAKPGVPAWIWIVIAMGVIIAAYALIAR